MSPLSIIRLPSVKKTVLSESAEESAQIKHRLQAKTVQNSSKQLCGWILMWETTGDGLFHWRKHYYGLWTQILVKNVLMDLFQFLSSQDVNWWTGVVWITCGLLWCFCQLFGLSFWRHPFTAEHPLLRHWCRDTFLQICCPETHLHGLRMSKVSANFHFWINYFFKGVFGWSGEKQIVFLSFKP